MHPRVLSFAMTMETAKNQIWPFWALELALKSLSSAHCVQTVCPIQSHEKLTIALVTDIIKGR